MTSESVQLIPLSLPLDQLMGYRQMCTTVVTPHFIKNVFFQGHRVCFSPHLSTHTDLPWSVPDWNDPKITSYLTSVDLRKLIPENQSEIEEWLNKALAPRTVSCLILNLTVFLKRIDSFLEKNELWETPSDHLKWSLTADEFTELFESLHINKELLHDRLGNYDIANKLIVLRSGWLKNFYAKNQDYSDPLNECFRTYLCHPYLMEEDVLWLINRKVAGIALDFPSPDEPLYYINRKNRVPYLRNLTETLPRSLSSVRPVHICLLSQGKLLVENLANLEKLQDDSTMVTEAEFDLFPLPLYLLDAAVLQVYGIQHISS